MPRLIGHALVLLALWVQILAPVTALRALAGPGDPLAGMVICGHGVADAASGDGHAAATPLCGLCCAAVAVLEAPPPDATGVALAWTVLVFAAPSGVPVRPVARTATRARDPPTLG